jgi:hypothetical protein
MVMVSNSGRGLRPVKTTATALIRLRIPRRPLRALRTIRCGMARIHWTNGRQRAMRRSVSRLRVAG